MEIENEMEMEREQEIKDMKKKLESVLKNRVYQNFKLKETNYKKIFDNKLNSRMMGQKQLNYSSNGQIQLQTSNTRNSLITQT